VGGVTDDPDARFFALDFAGAPFDRLPKDTHFHAVPKTSAGTVRNVVVEPNPEINGIRVTFAFAPGDAKVADLSCVLETDAGPISEQWLYRWTP
jgi:glucans biosynthesis protein